MKIKLGMSCLLSTLLTGCSAYNEKFDCPAGKGLGCQSMTEVKKKLDQGEIDMPETTTEAYQRRGSGKTGVMAPVLSKVPVDAEETPISFVDSNGMVIQRTPEKPLRVWVAPHQDRDGNLREASVIHTVVQGGYWKISPEAVS